jgi:hypothetical protein
LDALYHHVEQCAQDLVARRDAVAEIQTVGLFHVGQEGAVAADVGEKVVLLGCSMSARGLELRLRHHGGVLATHNLREAMLPVASRPTHEVSRSLQRTVRS